MSTTIAVPPPGDLGRAASCFEVASYPVRLQILYLLAQDDLSVGRLCEGVKLAQPAVSHHLRLMRATRMVEDRRDGRHVVYSLTAAGREIVLAASNLGKEQGPT